MGIYDAVGQTHYKIIYIWENIVHGIKLKSRGLTLGHIHSLTHITTDLSY